MFYTFFELLIKLDLIIFEDLYRLNIKPFCVKQYIWILNIIYNTFYIFGSGDDMK